MYNQVAVADVKTPTIIEKINSVKEVEQLKDEISENVSKHLEIVTKLYDLREKIIYSLEDIK